MNSANKEKESYIVGLDDSEIESWIVFAAILAEIIILFIKFFGLEDESKANALAEVLEGRTEYEQE